MKKLWRADEILSVAISKKTFGEATIAGKMYGFVSNWRGHRVSYIGEKGVVYSSERKGDFIRLPRKESYVQQIMERLNKEIKTPEQLKINW